MDGSTPSIDASVPGDSAIPPPPIDARQCFGVGLLQNLCLSKAPTAAVSLSSPINTDAAGTCTQVFPQTGSPTASPELCVIAGKTITVQGSVTVQGTRALVLIGAETVTVASSAALDASSTTSGTSRKGAGANLGACAAPTTPQNNSQGAGAGAGGSLSTKGGDGGDGNTNGGPQNTAKGGNAGATQPDPVLLRGGCPGGKGGDGQGAGGAAGDGGGALYLIAGMSITIAGDVFASGGGGGGTPNAGGIEQGGGGGGTGGMIGLDAPTLTITGRVVANGGAGAGGGGLNTGGGPGQDGTTTNWNQRAAGGGAGLGGSGTVGGAPGTAVGMTNNISGANAAGGGGGGGGGLGIVTIYGTVNGGTADKKISPAPILH